MDVIGPIADKPLPPPPPEKPPPEDIHEGAKFKPYGTNTKSKQVHVTIAKFPGYHKGAINTTKRRPPPPDDAPPPFKLTGVVHGLASTSIQTNTRNLKKSQRQKY